MNKGIFAVILIFFGGCLSAQAALLEVSLDGLTVTDPDTSLMWTQNASLTGGVVNWFTAVDKINELNSENYAGYTDWRLPETTQFTTVNSEFKHLYDFHLFQGESSLFSEYKTSYYYWSSEYSSNPDQAWFFRASAGGLSQTLKTIAFARVWAVRDIDASSAPLPTPLPAAVWLFGAGLIGVIGLARRHRSQSA